MLKKLIFTALRCIHSKVQLYVVHHVYIYDYSTVTVSDTKTIVQRKQRGNTGGIFGMLKEHRMMDRIVQPWSSEIARKCVIALQKCFRNTAVWY